MSNELKRCTVLKDSSVTYSGDSVNPNQLKPEAYFLILNDGNKELVSVYKYENICYDSHTMYGPEKIPLYTIPPGYHIVAIDPKQQILDTLDRHNDKVREGL